MRGAILALLLATTVAAQTPPSGTTYGNPKVDLSQTGTNTNPLRFTGTITGGTITAVQGNPPWRVTLDTGSVSAYQAGTWTVQALQTGAWHVTIDTGAITANVSGSSVTAYAPGGAALALDATVNSLFKAGQSIGNTVFGATQSGAWTVTANQGTSPWVVSVAALPLPSGAATSARQDQQTAELVAIDSNTAVLFKAGQSIGNTTFGASQSGAWTVTSNQGGQWLVATSSSASSVQASQLGPWTVTANQGGAWAVAASQAGSYTVTPGTGTFPVSAAALPLPAGAATSAGQALALTELVVIDTTTATLFKAGQNIGNTTFGASQTGAWTVTANQGGAPWRVTVDTGSITAFQGGAWSVAAAQSGAWTVTANQGGAPWSVTFPSPQAVTQSGGPWQVNQTGSFVVTPGTGTWPISAVSLPLPTGASTSANQTLQLTELVAVDTATSVTAREAVAIDTNTAAAKASLASIDGKITTTANGIKVDVIASALPAGAATSANQASEILNLASISTTTTIINATVAAISTTNAAILVQQVAIDSNTAALFKAGQNIGNTTFGATQSGGWTVTANQGGAPWQVNQAGSFVVTAGTGTWPVTESGTWNVGLNAGTNQIGLVSGSSVTAFQGGTWYVFPQILDASNSVANIGYSVGAGSVPVNVLATATPSDILPAAGTIGALGAASTITGLHGIGSAFVSITGAWVGTINIQSSVDGVVWSTNSTSVPGVSAFSQSGITTNGSFRIPVVGGFNKMRATFTAYTSGSATVQFFFSGPVADPFVFQSIAANLNAQVVGAQAVGNSVATSSPVVTGGADSGNLARSLYVDANGSTREAKDVLRQVVIASATAVAGTTSETIFTLTVSTAFTNGTSGTSFGVPAGKTFRIQSLNCVWRSGAVDASGTCRLRVNSSGACTASSPFVCGVGNGSLAANALLSTNQAAADHCIFTDGFELSGTQTFCVSHLDTGTGMSVDVTLVGYQY